MQTIFDGILNEDIDDSQVESKDKKNWFKTKDFGQVRKNLIAENVKLKVKDTLLKLKDLESVTNMGVNYLDYPKYVREVQFAINRFESEFGEQKNLIRLLNLCLKPYIQAQSYFAEYVRMRKGSMGEAEYKFRLSDCWETGSRSIGLFELNFNTL